MDANVSLSSLPSCWTLPIRAEYIWRMHRLLLVFGDTQDIVGSFATFSSARGQITALTYPLIMLPEKARFVIFGRRECATIVQA